MSEGFAAVPTWMVRDTENISGYAIAVYTVLATYSGYRVNAPGQNLIAREARCSERKVRDALIELEALGVIERVKRGSKAGGRRSDAYRLMDRPLHDDEQQLPAPSAEKGLPAQNVGVTGTSEQTIPYIEIDKSEIDKTPTPYDLEALFDEAWKAWPKKKEKKKSLEKFKAKSKEFFQKDPQKLVDLISKFGHAYAATTELQYVPALCWWLNRERWTDTLPVGSVSRSEQRLQNNLAVVDYFSQQSEGREIS